MTSVQRNRTTHTSRHLAWGSILFSAALLGGCSADVTRFDFPAFNLSENATPTGSLPAAPPPTYGKRPPAGYETGPLTTPRGAGLTDDAVRNYPQTPPYQPPYQQPYQQTYQQPTYQPPYQPPQQPTRTQPTVELAPVQERTPPRVPRVAGGETIEVQPGDTLFGIAKRHNVPVSALIEVNGLQNGTAIKPGQRLVLPGSATPTRTPVAVRQPPPAPQPMQTPQMQTQPADVPGWDRRYTMNPGDSLYSIARQHRVTLADLQRVNGITDPTKVRAGTVLMVPGAAESDRGVQTTTGALPQPPATQPSNVPRVLQDLPGQPKVINGVGESGKTASRSDTLTDSTDTGAPVKFRWPVTGRMVASFGKRPDGTHNDGINLAVPLGTDVKAADGGRVVYAGSELKGYGNLILLRHDNGWVTAYAHNEELLVKRDDVVKRGQVIARSGKSGSVDQPQVHFELRQGAKPVDPLPYLERN